MHWARENIGSWISRRSLRHLTFDIYIGSNESNPYEVLLVCVSAPIGVSLYHGIHSLITSATRKCDSGSSNIQNGIHDINTSAQGFVLILLEAVVVLVPMIICQTEFLYPHGCCILAFELLLAIGLRLYRSYSIRGVYDKQDKANEWMRSTNQLEKLDFLTVYRYAGSTMVLIEM